jgi:predicted nucleic acid-binding Zn ribbon protein
MNKKTKSKLDSIGDILSKYFAKNPTAQKKLQQYSLFAIWDEVVGERVAKHAQPARMMDTTLVVRVDHSSWMHELQLMKPDLLRRIHAHVAPKLIKDIRLEIGKIGE